MFLAALALSHPFAIATPLVPFLLRPQAVPLEEQLEALAAAVAAGKVRAVGVSNETPWGLTRCVHLGVLSRRWVPAVW